MNISRLTLGAAFSALLTVSAHAQVMRFHAALEAASEVPPKAGAGKGTLDAALDTASKTLTYTLAYSDLSGPAVAAHFHGPAAPGANAGVAVPIADPASGGKGSVKLNDAQESDLEHGMWYVNVHTAANPGGEIRGQVMQVK